LISTKSNEKPKKAKPEKIPQYRPNKTNIGGQSVIEGVMMRGSKSMATAVRNSNGVITMETSRIKSAKDKNFLFHMPFVRGIVNFGSQMFAGTALLMRSAEVYGDFAEPSKFENWFAKKFKMNPMNLILGFSVVLGIALAILLFVFLPNFLSGLFFSIPKFSNAHPVLHSLVEGLLMIIIFVIYIVLVSAMKDIRRVFQYHGAEHKVISCYEHGLELTVENAQKMSTAHSRCGTTFMFFVLMVSIFVFAFVNWALVELGWTSQSSIVNSLIKLPAKLLFVPIIAGISYEILKFLAKYDNLLARILRAPGMWLQKLTTKQPTDDMVECSLAAFKMVLAMDADETIPTRKFEIKVPYPIARKRVEGILGENAEQSDIDWLFVEATSKRRSELPTLETIDGKAFENVEKWAKDMVSGKPLQYVLGNTEFYGLKLSLTKNVLIPRPETEQLVEEALKYLGNGSGKKVLDLCCGSGAIALAVAKNTESEITASDISKDAIAVASANALALNLKVKFAVGDLFTAVAGEKFDVVISNPPYIKHGDIAKLEKKVKDFEPTLALDGGEDGLNFYRLLAKNATEHLNEGGAMFMEIGAEQGDDVKAIFADYASCEVKKDLNGLDRIIVVRN